MFYKRSRSTFETDNHAPYAVFGTPLPDEAETRDDGSYVPLWKQEVRDERGRKRLHGAFTGGWSAGYFNSVGSKEGWTPSTFVSSRANRHKDAKTTTAQQRAEDFMDDEDLADAAEAQRIQTSEAFAGLGSSTQEEMKAGGLMGLFRASGDTMGLKLLRRMGWKDGQGIGPKIRRRARLDVRTGAGLDAGDTHLFAPDNTSMIRFDRKTDRKGLGHNGETKLSSLRQSHGDDDEDEDELPVGLKGRTSLLTIGRNKPSNGRAGMGVGILNDNGSDDEDPYEMGPKIKYNRVIGGDKKKKANKKAVAATNPLLKNAPIFVPKTARAKSSLRRCHDGRLPLDGFVLAREIEDLTAALARYTPPSVPPGWKSAKAVATQSSNANYTSTVDAAKASSHDPRSRAALLGEKSLPGKSVFDYISTAARDKLAAASGRPDLPPARGEAAEEYAVSDEERQKALWNQIPGLDRDTALAAISRSSAGPYADNVAKKARYKLYLEHQANPDQPLPKKPSGMTDADFLGEMTEFFNCARIFKPMTGFMASRFTTAKTSFTSSSNPPPGADLVSKPEPKLRDPAEEAAKVGMFGQMTRSSEDFYPTRLLCKRFNVMPPAHSRPDNVPEGETQRSDSRPSMAFADLGIPARADVGPEDQAGAQKNSETPTPKAIEAPRPDTEVNPDKNEAVEGKAAHEDVLRAIFGDSDSESPIGLTWLTRPARCYPFISTDLTASQPPVSNLPAPRADTSANPILTSSIPRTQAVRAYSAAQHTKSATLSASKGARIGPSASPDLAVAAEALVHHRRRRLEQDEDTQDLRSDDSVTGCEQSPPPQYPASEAPPSPRPPPFSSLYQDDNNVDDDSSAAAAPESSAPSSSGKFVSARAAYKSIDEGEASGTVYAAPAYAPLEPESSSADVAATARAFRVDPAAETKRALPRDTKGESSRKDDDAEPPPAYTEGDSPLLTFTYLMAAAGGAASIITQVQQGGPPVNAIGDVGADETIAMDLRGTRFVLSRDELLTLPEFVLLSLFPNGLFPEGHMNGFSEGDAVQVDYDPASLQYMLDFFRNVAQSIPQEPTPSSSQDSDAVPIEPLGSRDEASRRAGIIVLREDLDFYVIPPRSDISQPDMVEVKRATARALQQQDGIFSGLKRSDEPGTTEAHLIEMLTAGGFNHDDQWGHRAGEPNKAVICSLALARLRSDIRGNEMGNNSVGMAQKLLLFWRKPARRCWWEGIELDNVDGVEGKLKVWIRRVWTLEMSVIGLR